MIVEPNQWAIHWVGKYLHDKVNAVIPGTAAIISKPDRLFGRVAHFNSWHLWLQMGGRVSKTNETAVTFLHLEEDLPGVEEMVERFRATAPRIGRIVTSNRIMEARLREWGVPSERIVLIPLGIDTSVFVPPSEGAREAARRKFGVPEDAICIGSFQKDGRGWGEGNEPKTVKGPEVFVETVGRLAKDWPVYVLLTGPSRGYVKSELAKRGVPFGHFHLDSYPDVVECYYALDLYIICSWAEGGPLSLMESWGTRVPVVSTNMGMPADHVVHCENGLLAPVGDSKALAKAADAVLRDPELRDRIVARGAESLPPFDWGRLAERYYREVYAPLRPRMRGRPDQAPDWPPE